MRVRHKVPLVFSLSMVDMLCCALGCIILVWLLNAKQAEDDAVERQQEIDTLLARSRQDREESERLLAAARGEHSLAAKRALTLSSERDEALATTARLTERIRLLTASETKLGKELASERSRARDLTGKLEATGKRLLAMESDVRIGLNRLDDERKKVAGLERRVDEKDRTLEGARADLARREAALRTMQTDLAAARALLRAERERADKLAKTIDARASDLAALGKQLAETRQARGAAEKTLSAREKDLLAAAARERQLEKDLRDRLAALTAANAKLTTLEKDRLAALNAAAKLAKDRDVALAAARGEVIRLEREKDQIRVAAENRFAGITLTGRRVIFLVDTSGSMEMLDDETTAPNKWLEVRNTLSKLLRSLPDLEKFQVITFAARVDYLLGSADKWLTFDAKTSPDQAFKALAATRPRGGTNMYAALDAAFRYRDQGLDTIYLLSDGLPNQGEGLTATQNKSLRDVERATMLGKHVRTTLRTNWNRARSGAPRVKIHTIGFFYESPDLGAFLWSLARENEGSFVGMSRP